MASIVLSDNSLNTYGGRVLTQGLDLEGFKKNPVMLFMHDRYYMPIGKWDNIRIEGEKLIADPVFDEEDWIGGQVKRKFEKGILNAASIGVDILELSNDPADLLPGQTRGTVKKGKVFEASIVDIPGNENAVRLRSNLEGHLTLADGLSPETLNQLLPPIVRESDMKNIALKLGLDEKATEKQIIDAIEAIEATASKSVPALMALGRSKGVITDANQAQYEKLAKADFDTTLALVQNAPAPKAETDTNPNPESDGSQVLTVQDILKLQLQDKKPKDERETWTLNDWRQKDPDGLGRMQRDEPEKFEKLMAPLRKVS